MENALEGPAKAAVIAVFVPGRVENVICPAVNAVAGVRPRLVPDRGRERGGEGAAARDECRRHDELGVARRVGQRRRGEGRERGIGGGGRDRCGIRHRASGPARDGERAAFLDLNERARGGAGRHGQIQANQGLLAVDERRVRADTLVDRDVAELGNQDARCLRALRGANDDSGDDEHRQPQNPCSHADPPRSPRPRHRNLLSRRWNWSRHTTSGSLVFQGLRGLRSGIRHPCATLLGSAG